MERRKRATKGLGGIAIGREMPLSTAARGCAVCDTHDARLLVMVELGNGEAVTLCGSHALLHARTGERARSFAELQAELGERRSSERRHSTGGDELGEKLIAAFSNDRRGAERRAG